MLAFQSALLRLMLNTLYFTWKIRGIKIVNKELYQSIKKNKPQYIYVTYHGLVFLPVMFLKRKKGNNIVTVHSKSKEGDLMAHFAGRFGYTPLRGSSNKHSVKVLVQMKKMLSKGFSAGITIDGPTGPPLIPKPGALFLAQKTGTPIVTLTYSAKKYFQIKSWDKFVIPKPFTKITIILGDPIKISKDDDLDLHNKQLEKDLKETCIEHYPDYIRSFDSQA